MQGAFKTLVQVTQLGNAAARLYDGGSLLYPSAKVFIGGISLCNTDTVTRTFSIHIVPAGGSASASNARYYQATIPAKTTFDLGYLEGEFTLDTGYEVWAGADVASVVNFSMYGLEAV